jgi:hypothetical protein
MRLDRTSLLRLAIKYERERREAKAEAAWQEVLDKIEEMTRRFVALPRAGDRELAEQFARARDWARIDELRMPADLARAEAVALAWTVNPAAATRLLSEYWRSIAA